MDELTESLEGLYKLASMYDSLTRSAHVAFACFDVDMKYVWYNPYWKTMYSLPADKSLVGRSHYEIFPEIDERWKGVHQRVITLGELIHADADVFEREDGSVAYLRYTLAPWLQRGRTKGIVMTTLDVTDAVNMGLIKSQRIS